MSRTVAVLLAALLAAAASANAVEAVAPGGDVDCSALLKALDVSLSKVLSGAPDAVEVVKQAAGAEVPGGIARAHRDAYAILLEAAEISEAVDEGLGGAEALGLLSRVETLQADAQRVLNSYSNLLLGCAGEGGLALKVSVDSKVNLFVTVYLPRLHDTILALLQASGDLAVDAPSDPVPADQALEIRVRYPEGTARAKAYVFLPAALYPYSIYEGQPRDVIALPAPSAAYAYNYTETRGNLVPATVVVEAYGGGGDLLARWMGTVQFKYLRPPVYVRVPAVAKICGGLHATIFNNGGEPVNATIYVDGEEYVRVTLVGETRIALDTCNMTDGYHVITVKTDPAGPYRPLTASSVVALEPPLRLVITVANPSIDVLGRIIVGSPEPPPVEVNLTVVVSDRNYTVTLGPEKASEAVHPSLLPIWAGHVEVYTQWSRKPVYEGRVVSVSPPALLAVAAVSLPVLMASEQGAARLARQIARSISMLSESARSMRATLAVYLSFLYSRGAPPIMDWETLREHLDRAGRVIDPDAYKRATRALPLVEEDLYSPRRVPASRIRRVLKSED